MGTYQKGSFTNHVDKMRWVVDQMSMIVHARWVGCIFNVHVDKIKDNGGNKIVKMK